MSDKAFERGLTALTFVVLVSVICLIVFGWLGVVWSIIIGLVVEIGAGGAMLYFWGKDYMSRTR
jgi:hypothetical protein